MGPKVADCIALFSMDKSTAIPVDTHVFQIATRDYGLKMKTLTMKGYQQVRDVFVKRFGAYAGWAHSVLFAADLGEGTFEFDTVKKEGSSRETTPRKKVKVEKRDDDDEYIG